MSFVQPHFVPKGVTVFSTAPNWPREGRESKAGRSVLVVEDPDGRIVWVGSGGYWRWYYPAPAQDPRP